MLHIDDPVLPNSGFLIFQKLKIEIPFSVFQVTSQKLYGNFRSTFNKLPSGDLFLILHNANIGNYDGFVILIKPHTNKHEGSSVLFTFIAGLHDHAVKIPKIYTIDRKIGLHFINVSVDEFCPVLSFLIIFYCIRSDVVHFSPLHSSKTS